MSTTLRTTAILAALLLVTALAPARALDQNPGAIAGKTLAEWSALWWQWMVSIPVADNPQMAQGEVDCGVGQQGPVWFLAGAPSGVTAQRSCTVPRGKALFFPVFNAVFINGPGENLTVAEKRDALDGFLNDTDPGPFTAEVDEIFEAEDDRVVTLGRDSGTFKATGKSMEAPTASIWTLDHQGRVVRFVQYIDTQKVISATLP